MNEKKTTPSKGAVEWKAPARLPFENATLTAFHEMCETGAPKGIMALLDAMDQELKIQAVQPYAGPDGSVRIPLHRICLAGSGRSFIEREPYLQCSLELLALGTSLDDQENENGPMALAAVLGLGVDQSNPARSESKLSSLIDCLETHPQFGPDLLRKLCFDMSYMSTMRARTFQSFAIKYCFGTFIERHRLWGLDINEVDASGFLPIGRCKSAEQIERLCSAGADPFKADSFGKTALARVYALSDEKAREKALEELARQSQLWISAGKAPDGALGAIKIEKAMEAAKRLPRSEFVSELKRLGLGIDCRHPGTGASLLVEALRGGRYSSAQWLLERGLDPMALDDEGRPGGIWLAASERASNTGISKDGLAKLMAGKIDWTAKSKRGLTAAQEGLLLCAASDSRSLWGDSHREMLKRLIQELGGSAVADVLGSGGVDPVEAYARKIVECRRGLRRNEDRHYWLPSSALEFAKGLETSIPGHSFSDWACKEVLESLLSHDGPSNRYQWAFLGEIAKASEASAMPKSVEFIANNPKLREKLADAAPDFLLPSLRAKIEAFELNGGLDASKPLKPIKGKTL